MLHSKGMASYLFQLFVVIGEIRQIWQVSFLFEIPEIQTFVQNMPNSVLVLPNIKTNPPHTTNTVFQV